MSVLAFVTVCECDHCRRAITLKSDLEYASFDETWYAGLNKHFCHLCRERPDTQAAIAEDLQLQATIAGTIRSFTQKNLRESAAETEVNEYAN